MLVRSWPVTLLEMVVVLVLLVPVMSIALRPKTIARVQPDTTWKLYRRWWIEEKQKRQALESELALLQKQRPYR